MAMLSACKPGSLSMSPCTELDAADPECRGSSERNASVCTLPTTSTADQRGSLCSAHNAANGVEAEQAAEQAYKHASAAMAGLQ